MDERGAEPDGPELHLARWTAADIRPARMADVESILVEEFRAYRIPLECYDREDLENDEEVRADLVSRLYAITHPAVLRTLWAPGQEPEPDDVVEEYWQFLLRDLPDHPDEVPYRLLLTQQALGQRVSVVLEQEGDAVTGFKAYGLLAEPVQRRLLPEIGSGRV